MADAVSIAPDIYKVLFENDRVGVLSIRTAQRASSEMHSHPDMVLFAVSDCDWKLTTADGESVEAHIPADGVFYQEATSHAAEDIGASGSYAIAIELK